MPTFLVFQIASHFAAVIPSRALAAPEPKLRE